MHNLLNYLFPTKCLVCGRPPTSLCSNCLYCFKACEPICLVCGRSSPKGLTHQGCFSNSVPKQTLCHYSYQSDYRQVFLKTKYGPKLFGVYSALIRNIPREIFEGLEPCIIVPVPIHANRLRDRGFNQAEKIAVLLNKRLGHEFKVETNALFRRQSTDRQHLLGKSARQQNIQGSFYCNPQKVFGRRILLVDDIITTGSTLLECSRVVLESGAAEVKCFGLSFREKSNFRPQILPTFRQNSLKK